MRKLAIAVSFLLLATACGSDSESAELEALREKVATLEAQTTTVVPATPTTGEESAWPDEYQTGWMRSCEAIFADVKVDYPSVSPSNLCRCTLDGLMEAFSFNDYAPWTQDVQDSAAVPYVTMCWPEE